EKVRMYYDPRGQVVKTINPDDTQQLVVLGVPNNITELPTSTYKISGKYKPTPWESYTYDANDLAQVSHQGQFPAVTGVSPEHYFTPKNVVVDAIGRILKTTDRVNGNEVVMKYEYDIRKNLLKTTDALGRIVSINKYNLANQVVKSTHLDAGVGIAITDATGKPVQVNDSKGAIIISAYDTLNRPVKNWAKDKTGEDFTQRQFLIYGDSAGLANPEDDNLLGKIYKHYDEAGLTKIENYDFKGSVTEKKRQVIKDSEILSVFGGGTVDCYRVNWDPGIEDFDTYSGNLLDSTIYQTNMEYDALNRATKITYPADIFAVRKEVIPVFNNAGALEKITSGGTDLVKHIAYNAKGQKILVAWGNDVMMRYAYDPNTFRLNRVKAEKYTFNQSGNTHTYVYDSGTTRYDQKYKYDFVGNIVNVTDKTPDCGITGSEDELFRQFEYDALYRLIFANGREMNNQSENYLYADAPKINNPTASDCRKYERKYEYDLMGNIQKLKHRVPSDIAESFTRAFEYESGTNHLEEINNGQVSPTTYSEFTYDSAGNTTGNNSNRVYEWDYANRMRSFYTQASGSITKYTHYLYDAGGNRIKKLTRKNSGSIVEVTTYIDGIFEYHKRDTSGDVEEKNYLQVQGGIEFRIGGFDDDASFPDIVYTITDYLGSASIRLDDSGDEIDREDYYPFGDTAVRTFESKRYRFTGKEKDDESGLYYYGARYYAAWTCRFISVDPLTGKSPGLSPYHYTSNNPIVRIDPTGLQDKPVDAGGGGGESGENKTSQSKSNNTTIDTVESEPYIIKDKLGKEQKFVDKTFYKDDKFYGEICGIEKPMGYKAETSGEQSQTNKENAGDTEKTVKNNPAANEVKDDVKTEATQKIEQPKSSPEKKSNNSSTQKSEGSTSQKSTAKETKSGSSAPQNKGGNEITDIMSLSADLSEAVRQVKGIQEFGTSIKNVENTLKEGKFIHQGNGKTYSQKFKGNQYISSKSVKESISNAKFFKVAGNAIQALDLASTFIEFGTSEKKGSDVAKLVTNLAITAVAVVPIVGPALSIGLGIAETFGAFNGMYNLFK
ncbi:MAG: RHS repeat domain-containing protein, partial [Bacteroidia bacterium]